MRADNLEGQKTDSKDELKQRTAKIRGVRLKKEMSGDDGFRKSLEKSLNRIKL